MHGCGHTRAAGSSASRNPSLCRGGAETGESYRGRRLSPTGLFTPDRKLHDSSTKRSFRVNSIIYIVGLVVVVVAVLSFFGLR